MGLDTSNLTSNRVWSKEEDQYLFDATLRGQSFDSISYHLSETIGLRTAESCKDRVSALTELPRCQKHPLPTVWLWSIDHLKTELSSKRQFKRIKLADEELIELCVWEVNNRTGINPRTFMSKRCTEWLRRELGRSDKSAVLAAGRHWREERRKNGHPLADGKRATFTRNGLPWTIDTYGRHPSRHTMAAGSAQEPRTAGADATE